jgi:hypothetical protein
MGGTAGLGAQPLGDLEGDADLAIRMIRHPRNRVIWRHAGANAGDNVLFEQYLLAACLEYHHITARYLFDSMEESFDEDAARLRGYTHLIGGAKRNRVAGRSDSAASLDQRQHRKPPSGR